MKAMIFAAGLGTRLKPITNNIPKAMLPVAEKPLIQHVIENLKQSGFDEIIINVHHFADQIIRFVTENNNFGIHITFSDERDELLETGGGIKKAIPFFNDNKPFLVHNVDILSDVNLKELYNEHLKKDNLATLLITERPSSRQLLWDENYKLRAWVNESTQQVKPENAEIRPEYMRRAFSGIHVISPEIFQHMDSWNGKFSIIDFYLSLVNQNRIGAYDAKNVQIIDVGKIETISVAQKFIAERNK